MTAVPEVPRWLELQFEIDLRLFLIGELLQQLQARSPMGALVDEATGHEAHLREQANDLMAELGQLRAEWDAEVPS